MWLSVPSDKKHLIKILLHGGHTYLDDYSYITDTLVINYDVISLSLHFNFSWVIIKSFGIKEKYTILFIEETTLLSSASPNLCLAPNTSSLEILCITLPQSLPYLVNVLFHYCFTSVRNVLYSFASEMRILFCPMFFSQDIICLPSHFLKEKSRFMFSNSSGSIHASVLLKYCSYSTSLL